MVLRTLAQYKINKYVLLIPNLENLLSFVEIIESTVCTVGVMLNVLCVVPILEFLWTGYIVLVQTFIAFFCSFYGKHSSYVSLLIFFLFFISNYCCWRYSIAANIIPTIRGNSVNFFLFRITPIKVSLRDFYTSSLSRLPHIIIYIIIVTYFQDDN